MNKENLLRARSNIVFILALAVGFALVMWIERLSIAPTNAANTAALNSTAGNGNAGISFTENLPATPTLRALSPTEKQWAAIAWKYFENNTDAKTGLVNSVDKYPAATMWDTASYLLGLISAFRIKLITQKEFDARMNKALQSLASLPLYDGALPNKSYSTASLAMVDYAGKPTQSGIGWSAIDIGRLLVPLSIVAWNYPEHAAAVKQVTGRWQLQRVTRDGVLYGMHLVQNTPSLLQEGRLGYEQYAAKAVSLLGQDAIRSLDYRAYLDYAKVYDVSVPIDTRDARNERSGGHNYVVSEPYMLDGLEFGWDRISQEFAWRVYQAQEARFRNTGQLTAVTEDHIDQAPYFVYNTVFSDGKAWSTLTEKGEDAARFRSVSVKAAFAWHALYRSAYTDRLMQAVSSLNDPRRGWYAGLYEEGNLPNKALTANTNAVVLESLACIATGKLLNHRQEDK